MSFELSLNYWQRSQDLSIAQQVAAQLGEIPCGRHLVAKYALSDINKPIGISAYELNKALPSVEQLERGLKVIGGVE